MITLILVLIFGTVGGALGEFAFSQHCIIGTAIGAFIGILVRLGGAGEGMEGLADAFDGFSD